MSARLADVAPLPSPEQRIATLREVLGHEFARPELALEALTHRSVATPRRTHGRAPRPVRGAGSNERLEFVGDRVLGLLVAEWLAERYPDEQEGKLGPRHAQLVSRPVLAGIATSLGLPELIAIAAPEARSGVHRTDNVLADALEALLGAMFFDAGLDPARDFVRRAWEGAMEAQARPPKDPKTGLQEFLLGRGQKLPSYTLVSADGPSHAPHFLITARGGGKEATGEGRTKRAAETQAATNLLALLEAR